MTEPKPWDFEGRFVTPSGETIWFHGESTPIQRANELVFNGMLTNITVQKQAEEERKNLLVRRQGINELQQLLLARPRWRKNSEKSPMASSACSTPISAASEQADDAIGDFSEFFLQRGRARSNC